MGTIDRGQEEYDTLVSLLLVVSVARNRCIS